MSNTNEKRQIARDALSKMNLTKYDNAPEKVAFVNDRNLASQLGVSRITVWKARRALMNQVKERSE